MVTRDVNLKYGTPVGNYSGCEYVIDNKKSILSENLFIVNEETILEETYFKIKYKNNEQEFYYVQVELNPEKVPINFKNIFDIDIGWGIHFFPAHT